MLVERVNKDPKHVKTRKYEKMWIMLMNKTRSKKVCFDFKDVL